MSVAVKCYSKVGPHLFIGDKYASRDRELLRQLNIKTIINCTTNPKNGGGIRNYFPSDFYYLRVPVKDSDLEDLSPYFAEACELIERSLRQKFNVLIHCQQGVSRSATIVLAYLLYKGETLKDAYLKLKTARPIVKPKTAFLRQLVTWDKKLNADGKADIDRKRTCKFPELPSAKRKKISPKSTEEVAPPLDSVSIGPRLSETKPPSKSNPSLECELKEEECFEKEVTFPPEICP